MCNFLLDFFQMSTNRIHVVFHPVVLMLTVTMEFVNVCQNTKATLTLVVGLNA